MKNTIAICALLVALVTGSGSNTTVDAGDFKYQTLHNVRFDIRVLDVMNTPLNHAVIRVTTNQSDVTNAVTSGDGVAAFNISVTGAVDLVSLIVEHSGCVTKTVNVDEIHGLSLVSRTVYLRLNPGNKPKPDRDGDAVPDDADEFPDDPYLIGTAHGAYTIVYEDGSDAKDDADFNDCAVRLDIREYIDNNNMISRIVVTSKVLAAGAGQINQFWISVLDKDYSLIVDPKKDLGGSWNTRKGERFAEGTTHTLEIPLEAPVARDTIEPMPYDPYLLCGGERARQAHLPFVKTKFAGNVNGGNNSPRAILIPSDWAWPYESTAIEAAYPDFRAWHESKGAEHGDWYLHPEVDRIFNVSPTTVLSAYLLKVSPGMNTGIMLGFVTFVLAAIAGMNLWRKRRLSEQCVVSGSSMCKTNNAV